MVSCRTFLTTPDESSMPTIYKDKVGRPRTITLTQVHGLLLHASAGNYSARQLHYLLNLPVIVRPIQQLLLNCDTFVYKKMKTVPMLTSKHNNNRYKWATAHIAWTDSDLKGVVFFDDEQVFLDVPDRFSHYLHECRSEVRVFSKRQ